MAGLDGTVRFTFAGQALSFPGAQVMLIAKHEADDKLHDVVVRHGPHNYTQFTAVTELQECE